jgi:predicted nuclease of predicted toxin-antitoxin system
MGKIKIYTDEDLAIAVSRALRLRGFEAFTTKEQEKSQNSDEEQLGYATSIGSVLLTHNIHDFPRIHYDFMKQGKHHNGIIIAKQISIGEIVKSFLHLAATLAAEDMEDRLEYLSNW